MTEEKESCGNCEDEMKPIIIMKNDSVLYELDAAKDRQIAEYKRLKDEIDSSRKEYFLKIKERCLELKIMPEGYTDDWRMAVKDGVLFIGPDSNRLDKNKIRDFVDRLFK